MENLDRKLNLVLARLDLLENKLDEIAKLKSQKTESNDSWLNNILAVITRVLSSSYTLSDKEANNLRDRGLSNIIGYIVKIFAAPTNQRLRIAIDSVFDYASYLLSLPPEQIDEITNKLIGYINDIYPNSKDYDTYVRLGLKCLLTLKPESLNELKVRIYKLFNFE